MAILKKTTVPKLPKRRKSEYSDFKNLPLMLDVKDITAILRISKAGAYNLVNTKSFPKILVGKRVLVAKEDLQQWLERNKW